jgi:hypothetical protein
MPLSPAVIDALNASNVPTDEGPIVPEQPRAPDVYVTPSFDEVRADMPEMSDDALQALIDSTRWAPTPGAYTEAAGAGFARGAGEGSTFAGGMLAGSRLAAPYTSQIPHPVLRGVAQTTAALGGGLATSIGLADYWESLFPTPTDPFLVSTYEGSRTAGAGLGFAPSAFLIRKAPETASRFERMISAMGENARQSPKSFAAKELVMNAWVGAWGGGAVEQFGPDSPWIRFGTEVTASILSPARMLYDAKNFTAREAAKLKEAGISPRIQTQVTNAIMDLVEQQGENPEVIFRLLRQRIGEAAARGGEGTPLPTVGQLGVSPTLTRLERRLAVTSAEFTNTRKETAEKAFQTMRSLTQGLIDSGDPEALQLAVRMMEDNYAKQFNAAFLGAEARAMEAAQRLGPRNSQNRAELGRILQEGLESILRTARETESQLWSDAIRGSYALNSKGAMRPVKTKATNLAREFMELAAGPQGTTKSRLFTDFGAASSEVKRTVISNFKAASKTYRKGTESEEYLASLRMPDDVMASIDLKNTPVTELIKMRGQFLAESRKAAAGNDMNAARVYNNLAKAIMRDVEAIDNPAYAEATAFSKKLNDAFTRTFAGDMDDVTRTGQAKYAPETLVQRMFAGGMDPAYMRNKEIIQAANALDLPTEAAARTVLEAQQRMLKSFAASRAVKTTKYAGPRLTVEEQERLVAQGLDPTRTTRTADLIDPAAFEKWRTDNADTIRMLGMEDEFSDINKAAASLIELQDPGSMLNRTVRNSKALSKSLGDESPARAVAEAFAGVNPNKAFDDLFAAAKQGGPDAIAGLKSAIYSHALTVAENSNDFFGTLERVLFQPVTKGASRTDTGKINSIARMMASKGILTPNEVRLLRNQVLKPAKRVEDALANGDRVPEDALHAGPGQVMSALDDLLVAQIGARAAKAISPGGPGSLSFAARTIKKADNFFNRLPARQRQRFMLMALEDPQLMQEMMRTGRTAVEKRALNLSILSRLYSPQGSQAAAFRTLMEDLNEQDDAPSDVPVLPDLTVEEPAPVTTSRRMLRDMPTAQTRGIAMAPAAAAPQQMAAAPAQGPAPTGQGSSREMLQRLFPMDTMLG